MHLISVALSHFLYLLCSISLAKSTSFLRYILKTPQKPSLCPECGFEFLSLLIHMSNPWTPTNLFVFLSRNLSTCSSPSSWCFETHVSNSQWNPSPWVYNYLFIQVQDPPGSTLLSRLPLLALLCLIIQPSIPANTCCSYTICINLKLYVIWILL